MKRLYFLSTLVLTIFAGNTIFAQDFSNKGKDFWVGYGYHERMTAGFGGTQDMVLYFATEAITTVTVTIPGNGYSVTYSNIPANTVFTSNPIPKFGAQNATLNGESLAPENKGIHITSDRPIVAYAHIYNASVSGASILFPTNTLGKEYYSVNYKNVSNSPNSNCWFYVIACDTGTTTVEITPSAQTINHAAGIPFTVNLTQGQVYNVMGQLTSFLNPYTGSDLTGSKIQSISSGTGGCKRIAVFSGSGRISITCNGTSSSSDNYMLQAFPKTAWGKKYLTAPTGGVMPNNFFRICVLNPATVVTVNGAPIGLPLQNGFYYDINATATPQLIEADEPVLVAQYITSQGACGNGAIPGDPEVIYLSPVEQNINKVLWNATPNSFIQEHYFNVVIPNTGTAISSFKLDGVTVPAASFIIHPKEPGFSYLIKSVSSGQHTITSDSGFNAIAYGFGNAESYGYNAGTNVRDLYQFVTVKNEYATVNFPAACRSSPFFFSMTFPYQPTQIRWIFGSALNALGFADIINNSPAYDSTWVINGKQLYRYKLASSYNVATAGTYPIRILAKNPTSDGCSGDQEIDFDLEVYDPPQADFTFINNGCLTTPIQFTGSSTTGGRSNIVWKWDFDDGASSNVDNPTHTYVAPGSYNVKYYVITDVGCISDTALHTVIASDPPVAKFATANPYCAGKSITFSDQSTTTGAVSLTKWFWNFGDGDSIIVLNNANQTHTYASTGTYNVTLKVETNSGCQSTVFTLPVTVYANPVADFTFPGICLPSGSALFNDLSTITDGTQGSFTYQWSFGDGGTDVVKDPVHVYASTGPYNVNLIVTSNNGCVNSVSKQVNTISPEPQAAFIAPAEVCLGADINPTDQSTATGSSIIEWNWDFGDGTTSTLQNPVKNYSTPGTYVIKLNVTSAKTCQTVNNFATHTVVINPLPMANFNISSPGCVMGNITITDVSLANAGSLIKWTWDYGDGSSAILTNGAPFNHVYTATGNYDINLNVENNKGCASTIVMKPIVINDKPLADFISPAICLTDPSAPFFDSTEIASGSAVAWDWNFGDPNASVANPNTSTLQNPTHRYTVVGSYTASLIVTSNSGCKDTVSKTFVVNGSIPAAAMMVQNANTLCSNNAVNIVDASTVDFGSLIKVEVYWDFANDPTIKTTDDQPVPGNIYTHTYPEFGTPFTQTYTIKYVAYSGINCVNTFTKDITLLATPSLQFNSVTPVCSNQPSFQVTQAQLLNALPGSGVYSGTGISSSGLFNPAISGTGAYAIRYTYTGTNTCTNYVEKIVEVDPIPVGNAGPDKFVLEGGVVTLTPSVNPGLVVTYLWSPPTGLNDTEIAAAEASPADDITYTLTITTGKGCNISDQVFVKVLKGPVIPNIFSPNGDGVHDKWDIAFLETYPGCVVEVYNRYGQLVLRSVGYSKPWDGTINGKIAPIGTYYYIVDPKNGRKKMAGYVDIIR